MSNDSAHRETWLQIPWYVNERIDASLRARLDAHLQDCGACREELARQRKIHAAMSGDTGVEVLPSASLQRLRQRLDGATDAAAAPAAPAAPVRDTSRRWLVAAAVVLALGLALFATRTPLQPAAYHTVSDPGARAPQEAIRVVFTPQTTVERLQFLLGQAKARIVAGPTEAGVYSLALAQGQPVATALAQLRRQPEVRFAEATVPVSPGGAAPDGGR